MEKTRGSQFYPLMSFCGKCQYREKPQWLDYRLEEWNDLDIPYEEYRPIIYKVLSKTMCDVCFSVNMERFDRAYHYTAEGETAVEGGQEEQEGAE